MFRSVVVQAQRNPSPEHTLGADRSLRRLFWLALLLVHAWTLPSLVADAGRAAEVSAQVGLFARIFGLSLSAAFFGLKILDWPALRMRSGWRSWVTALVIVAVMHVGVMDRALTGEFLFEPSHLGLVFFVGTLWQFETIRNGLRHLAALSRRPQMCRSFGRPLGPGWRWIDLPAVYSRVFVPAFVGPRAPPFA
jgi:hypothetical protein